MFKRLKEKRAKAKAQREQEKREALALVAQKKADIKVCMKETEKSCRAGSVDFGLELSVPLKKNEELIVALRPVKRMEVVGEVLAGKRVSVIDEGEFILTNRRVIFSGENRKYSTKLSNITRVRPYNTEEDVGACIKRRDIYKISCFVIPSGLVSTNVAVEDRTYEVPFSGEQMVWLIKGAIKRNKISRSGETSG